MGFENEWIILTKMKGWYFNMKIGVTISNSKTQYYINQAYMDYLNEAGLQAFALTKNNDIDMAVGMFDGLVLPGGIDIDPIYYGEDNYSSYGVDPDKDEFEREVFHAFRKAGKPIFGICRGFQLIVCEYLLSKQEITKFLDFLPNIGAHNQVNDQQLNRTTYLHFVEYIPKLLYGNGNKSMTTMPVNSMHHQGLLVDFGKKGVIGTHGFKMAAWTTRGLKIKCKKNEKEKTAVVCEAFRLLDWGAPILAVQWHPEELMDIELIHNFFSEDSSITDKGSEMKA